VPQSFDELFAPKAMSLDELFAAIRPPPLLPVRYGPSDDDAYAPTSSSPAANMPQATLPATPNLVVPRGYTDDRTNERLQTLHPAVRQDFANFLDDVNNQLGIKLRITDGFRSNADQATEYAKGRTTPGPSTTGARPGESYHQYGMATDLTQLLPNGGVNYNLPWPQIAEIAAAHGIDWGGWFHKPDRDHFEKSLGHSTQELRTFPSMASPPDIVWPELPGHP